MGLFKNTTTTKEDVDQVPCPTKAGLKKELLVVLLEVIEEALADLDVDTDEEPIQHSDDEVIMVDDEEPMRKKLKRSNAVVLEKPKCPPSKEEVTPGDEKVTANNMLRVHSRLNSDRCPTVYFKKSA